MKMTTLFLAGQDTTAHALTVDTGYLLARHPAVETRLLDELRLVLAGREPRATDLPRLPYTEMIVREAMRLFPPAPAFARQPIEDVTVGEWGNPEGQPDHHQRLPAIHRDCPIFPEPEQFTARAVCAGVKEERIPRYVRLPLAAGPRVCIGNGFAMMEARLILATLAQRWKLMLEPDADIAPKQLVTLRPGRPVQVRVEKRLPANGS